MRSTRNQPFCWQEKKILRLIRNRFKKNELSKYRNLYLTITEIDSDFNNKDIKFFTKTIHKYSGLSMEWIPSGLKEFEKLNIIKIVEDKERGKFKGKRLIFTPELVKGIPAKTVNGKTDNGKPFEGKTKPSEDILLLEDITLSEDSININSKKEIFPYKELLSFFNEKTKKSFLDIPYTDKLRIYSLIKQGFTLDDLKTVIRLKSEEWLNTNYAKFLTFKTLFGDKFQNYLNQKITMTPEKQKEFDDYNKFRKENGLVPIKESEFCRPTRR